MKQTRKEIIEMVRHARRSAGLTQTELARKIGMKGTAQCYISHLENGYRVASLATLERIAKACGFWIDIQMRKSYKTTRWTSRRA